MFFFFFNFVVTFWSLEEDNNGGIHCDEGDEIVDIKN